MERKCANGAAAGEVELEKGLTPETGPILSSGSNSSRRSLKCGKLPFLL